MTNQSLWLTGDPEADALLSEDDNALLIGMVLDQQVPMEKAFSGPLVIAQRMGGRLDVAAIAAMSEDDFVALCSQRPAIHRFPAAMAKRVRQVCQVLTEDYDGQAGNVWKDARSGDEVKANLEAATRVWPRQGGHLHRGARQAAWDHAGGLARGGRLLRRARHVPLSCRHRRRRLAAEGAGDEEGRQGGQEGMSLLGTQISAISEREQPSGWVKTGRDQDEATGKRRPMSGAAGPTTHWSA